MAQSKERTLQHISTIRKAMQRSVHDCAGILDISEAKYLAFEQGKDFLSLPEFELLSLYLHIPLQELFDSNVQTNTAHHLLQQDIRQQYKRLREKTLQTKLILARQTKDLSLDELASHTGIPRETLRTYELGQKSIPLNDLKLICQALGYSIEMLLPDREIPKSEENGNGYHDYWQPEYPKDDNASDGEEDPYQQLLAALKQIPEEDQAQIAKQLLDKLKNI